MKIKKYKESDIKELVDILKKDGVISVPTDTVYGVCASIGSEKAKENLIKVKNRPIEKLFPIMCANKSQIKEIALVDDKVEILIDEFMPGAITLILKSKSNLPKYVNNGSETIAIRMAPLGFIKKLIEKLGNPLFMSSANQSGEPICENLDEIEKMCPNLNGIVEGNIVYGESSTIIKCIDEKIKIIRKGPITKEKIQEVLIKNNINMEVVD